MSNPWLISPNDQIWWTGDRLTPDAGPIPKISRKSGLTGFSGRQTDGVQCWRKPSTRYKIYSCSRIFCEGYRHFFHICKPCVLRGALASQLAQAAAPTPQSIEKLMALTQAEKVIDAIKPQINASMKASINQTLKGHTPSAEEQIVIDGLIAFYQSPAGKSMLTKMPKLMQGLMAAMPALMAPMMEQMQAATKQMADDLEALKK